ncbi:choice-of-anchor Q domain-containing protein, partial [Dapis sp. BLCC M126]|uniref:choice-of-anchor Q domain-containing protein n=1 Tax=Dapis sp. BLCC M126 TaxID=3400189 RepID=UPI003CF6BC6C
MATFHVTNFMDDGDGSLRDAIEKANATLDADTITFDSSLTGQTIGLTSGELFITNPLTINGLGANLLTVDAQNNGFRVFNIDNDSDDFINVFINGLTITGGNPIGGGGGIFTSENLTVQDSIISGNTSTGIQGQYDIHKSIDGGGINSHGGYLQIINSQIINNEAIGQLTDGEFSELIEGGHDLGDDPDGGGVSINNGKLKIVDSTISDNKVSGGLSDGGGVYGWYSEITVINSTISSNIIEGTAFGSGGGIYNRHGNTTVEYSTIADNSTYMTDDFGSGDGGGIFSRNGDLEVLNSTVSGNSAYGKDKTDGGGIYSKNGNLTVVNSTIYDNSTAGNHADGGGIFSSNGTATITNATISHNSADRRGDGLYSKGTTNLSNTIIANSINGDDAYLSGNINTNVNNLIEDGSYNPSLSGDPGLGILQDNGGPTETQALLANSPAIDAGNTNENNDQRGALRDSNPDIGAVEFGGIIAMTQESNDTLLRAISTGLTIRNDGTFTYSGEIGDNPNVDPEQDVDLFKFDLGIGDRLRLPEFIDLLDENGNDTNVDAQVQVFDSTGSPISPPVFNSSDPGYVTYEVDEAGTFYVGISGSGNSSYDPNIEGSGSSGTPGKYDLTIETIGREMGGTQSKLYFSRDAAVNDEGLYILDTSTGNPTLVGTNGDTGANVGLAPSDTSSFLYGSEPYNLLKINADGSVANSIGSENFYTNGLAYDTTNNILYGTDGGIFYTVNQSTGNSISELDSPPVSLSGLAFGNGGVYGLGGSQDLLFYDPNTDQWSVIGDTGISSWQDAGLAFDAEKNVLYAKRDGDTLLYEIDVSTAQTTSIGDTEILEGGGLALVSDDAYEEPNDTIQRATHTGLTQKNHGTFSYFGEIGDNTNLRREDDVDFFKFELGLGERVRIPRNIELSDENGNFTTNAEVQLFDETGQRFPTTLKFLTDADNYKIYEANEAGTFYVGISGNGNSGYDPNTEGSGSGNEAGNYGLTIETIGRDTGRVNGSDRLFAVKNDPSSQIIELNPETGAEINSFSAPETFSSGPQGLAFDGNSLFFVNDNGFSTELWELDPDTGSVRDNDSISVSGEFAGLAVLDGKVYISDHQNRDIIEFDPVSDSVTNVLDIDGINGITPFFLGLAGITEPNALLVSDGNSSQIFEINPITGVITNSFTLDDPNSGDGVAIIDNDIYVGNFSSPEIDVFDRSGTFQRTINLNYPVSALSGDDIASTTFEESNDTLVRATHTGLTLTNPGTYTYSGKIGDNTNLLREDDVDLFKFDLDAGETIRLPSNIEIFEDDGSFVSLVGNAEIQLFDSTGNSISLSSDPDPNYVSYQAVEIGTFYVGISGSGNTNYDPNIEGSGSGFGSAAGNYDLTIETTGSRSGDEPNDTLVEATDTGLTLTNQDTYTFSGEIGDNTNILQDEDVDLFKFDLDIGETVNFNLPGLFDENNNPAGQATVRLFDSTGQEMQWDQGITPDTASFFTPIAGTFYLGISADGNSIYNPDTEGSGFGSFFGTYDLTIETIGRTMGNEEPNDIIREATDTGLTLTNQGTYTFSGEIGDNTNILQDED